LGLIEGTLTVELQYIFCRNYEAQGGGGGGIQVQVSDVEDPCLPDTPHGKKFWRQMLDGFTAPTPLIVDQSPASSSNRKSAYTVQCIHLPAELTDTLQSIGENDELEISTLVQVAWSMLLHHYSGERNIVFGVAVPGLPASRPESETALDNPTSLLPIRLSISAKDSVLSSLKVFHDLQANLRLHADSTLQQIRTWIEFPPDLPLFESAVVFEEVANLSTDIPLTLAVTSNNGLTLHILFDSERFDNDTIVRMLGHVRILLEALAMNPAWRVADLPLLTESERELLLVKWNETRAEFPEDSCLHQLFESQASLRPDSPAVIFQQDQVGYAELDRRANQLAQHLRASGVGPEVRVGICVERSVALIVAILGVLKAGGAYVPLDPAYPQKRLAFMLKDARVSILLKQEHLMLDLSSSEEKSSTEPGPKVVCLDADSTTIDQASDSHPASAVSTDNLAYIIFTSGSTGIPKGIALQHRGVVNNLVDLNRSFDVGSEDRVLAISSPSFDMCVYEVLGTLAAGGTIIIPEISKAKDPAHWADLLVRHRVTVWNSAPQLLEMLVDFAEAHPELRPRFLRNAILGGDRVPLTLPDRLKKLVEDVKVTVLGGATEASIHSTIYPVETIDPRWKSIPYGRPMANQHTYILDSECHPLPVGVPGELHLGGVGLARGYFERPDLTAEKFIPNPLSQKTGDRLYKTGDLACYLDDGNIELLGRIDHQVKIRGHRIELEEVVSVLKQHPFVQDSVVMAHEEGSGKMLVAYIVPASTDQGLDDELQTNRATNQVSRWQAIYDETYAHISSLKDPMHNFIGWVSSYSNLPFLEKELHELVNCTVERISSLQPDRVLEIGCGTGLLLYRIAPQCTQYQGTDISEIALRDIGMQLERAGQEMTQVTLDHRAADDFVGIEPNSIDTVILNSVTQHFPNTGYLLHVLEGAVNTVKDGGSVFVGDVRSLPLLEAFHTSIQLYRAPPSLPLNQLTQRIRKHMRQEKELWVDPAFFTVLKQHFPEISHVEIRLKRGHHQNEMNKFHYDVIIRVGNETRPTTDTKWLDWSKQELSLSAIRQLLVERQPEILGITRVPNARLVSEVSTLDILAKQAGPATVKALRDISRVSGVDPEDFWEIAHDLPYSIDICWSGSDDIEYYDVLLVQRNEEEVTANRIVPSFPAESIHRKPWNQYANNPLQGEIGAKWTPELRQFLQNQLPGYMVPSAFVFLDSFPLNPNGKVDRRALSAPDWVRPDLDVEFVAPMNPVEKVLTDIWSNVLGFKQIGVHDSFFELGGHSLKTTQIIQQINETFQITVPLRAIFDNPTVFQLARCIETEGQNTRIDVSKTAKTLIQLSQLSEDEMKAMLAEREQQ